MSDVRGYPRTAMERLLRPRSVAIVGASPTPGAFGANVLANLEQAGFNGELYLVNPKRTNISGRPCLASVDDLPEGVDCAVLAIPRASVMEAVLAATRRKVGVSSSSPRDLLKLVSKAGLNRNGWVRLRAKMAW